MGRALTQKGDCRRHSDGLMQRCFSLASGKHSFKQGAAALSRQAWHAVSGGHVPDDHSSTVIRSVLPWLKKRWLLCHACLSLDVLPDDEFLLTSILVKLRLEGVLACCHAVPGRCYWASWFSLLCRRCAMCPKPSTRKPYKVALAPDARTSS